MKLGIISDTHDNLDKIRKAVEALKSRNIGKVIHLGDYCSPFTLKEYKGLPMTGIFGNNDGDKQMLLEKAKEAGIELKGEVCAFEQDGLKIVAYHGKGPEIRTALALCGEFDVVLLGHNHRVEQREEGEGKTLVLNPGSAAGLTAMGKGTLMIFDTKTRKVEVVEV